MKTQEELVQARSKLWDNSFREQIPCNFINLQQYYQHLLSATDIMVNVYMCKLAENSSRFPVGML